MQCKKEHLQRVRIGKGFGLYLRPMISFRSL